MVTVTPTPTPAPTPTPEPTPQPQAKAPDIEDLERLLKKIYGENCVLKFPLQENTYGRLWPGEYTDGEQVLFLRNLEPYGRIDDEDLGEPPEPYTMELLGSEYKVGETVEIVLSNNSTEPDDMLTYGLDFCLDIQIDGVWYPLCPVEIGGMSSMELPAGKSTTFEINSKSLTGGWILKYVEELGKYVKTKDLDREVELIPGHYRYGKGFDTNQGSFFIYCEFDVVE